MIAHQRVIREREASRSPLASLDGCTVRAIDAATARPIILRYEWLGGRPTKPKRHDLGGRATALRLVSTGVAP